MQYALGIHGLYIITMYTSLLYSWKCTKKQVLNTNSTNVNLTAKENRIYIKVEFKESLGMNFFSPFQSEREFKVQKSCKCSQIICSRVH